MTALMIASFPAEVTVEILRGDEAELRVEKENSCMACIKIASQIDSSVDYVDAQIDLHNLGKYSVLCHLRSQYRNDNACLTDIVDLLTFTLETLARL